MIIFPHWVLSILVLLGALWAWAGCDPDEPGAVCGNGKVEATEHCDDGTQPGDLAVGACTAECTFQEWSPASMGSLSHPSVAMNASGRFVIAWQAEDLQGVVRVWAAVYQPGGALVVPPFVLDAQSDASALHPSVGMDEQGRFALAWQSGLPTSGQGHGTVWLQAFDPDGQALTQAVGLSQWTAGAQFRPCLAVNALGHLAVVWTSDGQDGDLTGVYARVGEVSGQLAGEEPFLVNTEVVDAQENPSVAMSPGGAFVIAWESRGQGST